MDFLGAISILFFIMRKPRNFSDSIPKRIHRGLAASGVVS